MPTTAFTDPDRAVDRLHALCDAWAEDGPIPAVIGQDGLHVLRLTLHEWVANLVQHAGWPGPFEIELSVDVEGETVRCAVEDTSAGFDFASQLERQKAILAAPAPSERGRGLLMLVTCAEDLEFRPAGPGARQRIAFALRDPAGGDLGALFRAVDLEAAPAHPLASGDGVAGPPAAPVAPRDADFHDR